MKLNFVIYAQTKETLTSEQAHVLLQDLPKEVRRNQEEKTGVHNTVVQGQPIVNIQVQAGTGKTVTAANTVEMLGKTHPNKRCIETSPSPTKWGQQEGSSRMRES